ncbi:TniQ family protein [Arcobacter cryaerophilus gv. pseudocryaerophilus]|uniref:TniQ family protein n=3 Tax=unclassified Arcobacter TaxID=2593671 RepID=A0AA96REH3_9BACT|nr:TniQ family protein [Arcobacter sp. AZ-2023]WPD06088.1 TniQ family protein [Arcobacter sp. DSM 115956]WPD08180.1 TniQ family protein [Arcobacter sp. DSM 115955]WNL32445.1 TniQ family protein [Arcobacter sp. AZ-2023]WNP38595.1 TniQ family protein [Arcobacter sp. AZ-2023]
MIKKIKNPLIEKSRFLIIPEPFEGEIFSSWFARCAYAHKTHPRTFWNLHFPKNKFIYSITLNIDATVSDDILQILSIKTSFNFSKLRNMTMKSYDGYLQEEIICNGNNKFLTNYRFCPKCWQEDKIPYIKKEHRVIFSTFCEKHKCYLLDKCPECKTNISLFKMFNNELVYEFCTNCGFKLANSRINYVKNGLKYKFNCNLINILKKGYIQLGDYYIYSFLFFDVISHISKLILSSKKIRINGIENKILKKISKKHFLSRKTFFSQISIKEQCILFSIILSIFEEFPKRLELFMTQNQLSNFEMVRDIKVVPYWYEESVNEIFPKIVYLSRMVSEEEILNGIKYLKKRDILVNQSNLTKLLGCNFFSSYNKLKILLERFII